MHDTLLWIFDSLYMQNNNLSHAWNIFHMVKYGGNYVPVCPCGVRMTHSGVSSFQKKKKRRYFPYIVEFSPSFCELTMWTLFTLLELFSFSQSTQFRTMPSCSWMGRHRPRTRRPWSVAKATWVSCRRCQARANSRSQVSLVVSKISHAGMELISLMIFCPRFRFNGRDNFLSLTHCGRDKWTPFGRRHFQVHFLEWKCLNSF